jgi:hypothetical protein
LGPTGAMGVLQCPTALCLLVVTGILLSDF